MARASLLLVLLALGSTHAGLNDLHEKDSVEKKDRDKKDFHRYEDWGMDWSDADMMQHPIDEGPRRVRPSLHSSLLLLLLLVTFSLFLFESSPSLFELLTT